MSSYVIITPFFPSDENFRGPFVFDFARAVTNSGKYDNVAVFVPKKITDKRKEYVYQGINVHLFPMIEMPSYIANGILNPINRILFLRALDAAGINIADIETAHAHTSPFASLAIALKRKNKAIKTLVHHHDLDPYTIRNGLFAGNRLNLWIRARNSIRNIAGVDVNVCVSKAVERNLITFPSTEENEFFLPYKTRLLQARRLNLKAPAIKRSIVLYNGVDISLFKKEKRPTSNKDFTIGCIGNFIDLKSQITLLKAIHHLISSKLISHIKVRMIGSGPLLEACKDYTRQHNLDHTVEFLQEVDHTLMPSIFHTFNLFVLPSYFEGFGCVYTEAAACGIPFVCCSKQGAAEYLAPGTEDLWTISPCDHIKLAEIILRQIKKPIEQHYRYPFDINILVNRFLSQF